MTSEEILLDAEERMEKAFDFLVQEYRTIRTGRASTAIVENVRVEYYGSTTPLKQLANLSVPQANLIVIKPFDASIIKDIEKAIMASSVGITPSSDGRIIRMAGPPLSGERRQQLAQQIKQMSEHGRVSIRNIRRDANKHIDQSQKDKILTEDEREETKKEMDELTKQYISKVDKLLKIKTEEIMEV